METERNKNIKVNMKKNVRISLTVTLSKEKKKVVGMDFFKQLAWILSFWD